MRSKEVVRYRNDLGWRDAPDLPEPVEEAEQTSLDTLESVANLDQLAGYIEGCTRCRLSEKRHSIVVGEGDGAADLMFIGEGPGAEEDRTGRPFVGQAGRLLDSMIFALGFDRSEVYIGNVVKCRPPSNRDPEEAEMAACSEFLDRQIELIEPRIIVALGRIAARHLTGTGKPMGALRGRWASYRGISLMPIFHPAYLLRNQIAKRQTWEDLKLVRQKLTENS